MGAAALLVGALIADLPAPSRSVIAVVITLLIEQGQRRGLSRPYPLVRALAASLVSDSVSSTGSGPIRSRTPSALRVLPDQGPDRLAGHAKADHSGDLILLRVLHPAS